MQTFPLGSFNVGRVGYGAMQLPGPGVFGPPRDHEQALAVLRRAIELGINHIDTSQFYGPNVANQLIREALHPYPADLALVSKVGAKRDETGAWLPAQEPDELRAAIEENLETLGTDRLAAVKQVLDEFLARREGDRVGVVVFGDAPYSLVPFTTDLKLCRRLVQEMQVGMAGPRTALGDAIGLGVNLFARSTVPARTIIALTDGNDTASKVPTADAARVARDHKITIHTVAVGDPAAAGEDKLDEAALRDVASATGGGFYRALDRAQLADIYTRLDQIETRKVDTVSFRPKTDFFWLPLLVAMFLSPVSFSSLAKLGRWRRLTATEES